jgi:hypothetical protein
MVPAFALRIELHVAALCIELHVAALCIELHGGACLHMVPASGLRMPALSSCVLLHAGIC